MGYEFSDCELGEDEVFGQFALNRLLSGSAKLRFGSIEKSVEAEVEEVVKSGKIGVMALLCSVVTDIDWNTFEEITEISYLRNYAYIDAETGEKTIYYQGMSPDSFQIPELENITFADEYDGNYKLYIFASTSLEQGVDYSLDSSNTIFAGNAGEYSLYEVEGAIYSGNENVEITLPSGQSLHIEAEFTYDPWFGGYVEFATG